MEFLAIMGSWARCLYIHCAPVHYSRTNFVTVRLCDRDYAQTYWVRNIVKCVCEMSVQMNVLVAVHCIN